MGYYVIDTPLVRSFDRKSQKGVGISATTIRALNLVQNTPWAINGYIAEVVGHLWVSGSPLLHSSLSERPVWNKEVDRELNMEALERWESDTSAHHEELMIYNTAMKMRDHDRFYFPHNLDFRGRMYPVPSPFSPQGSDLSKGLLRFADGLPLGEDGLRWLTIAVANASGQGGIDKASLQDRSLWTWSHIDDLERITDDPHSNLEWTEFEDPFQFLALAVDLIDALSSPNPEDHVSFLPIHIDGSCNGLQHLSLMGRDPLGAKATNCSSEDQRFDLYQEVATAVLDIVQDHAAEGREYADEVLPKFIDPKSGRKIVKRAVMTTPYGVTSFGIREFMMDDGHVADLDRDMRRPVADYLRDLIVQALEKEVSAAKKIQRYFAECAKLCADAGVPMVWETSAGSLITQSYPNCSEHRIKTMGSTYKILKPLGDDHQNVSRMVQGAPPNVVHAADAAHLQLSVVAMAEVGIEDFAMVHDSFGTHAANVEPMRDILRNELAGMYEVNYLKTFKDSVEKHTGLKMPNLPRRGTFDVSQVREAPYVFS